MNNADRIDLEDLRKALGTCMHDPDLQRMFKGAPEGAKRVLKIVFCSFVFPDSVDRRRAEVNIEAIVRELDADDFDYLRACEVEEGWKKFFQDLATSGKQPGAVSPGMSEKAPLNEPENEACRRASLRVIRNEAVSGVDLNAEAIKRKIAESEAEKEEEVRKGAILQHRAKAQAMRKNAVCVALGVVVLACGWFWYSSYSARRAQEEKARLEAERAREAELQKEEEARRQETERLEQERAARREQEKARQVKEEAERKERQETEAKRKEDQANRQKAERQEEAERREQERLARERFEFVRNLFRNAKPQPWRTLDKARRPGAVEGTFHCAIPDANGGVDLFAVESSANGSVKVVLMSEKDAVETPFAGWNDRLRDFGGVVHDGSKVYLFLPKAKDAAPLPLNDFDPSKMRLGELAGLVRDFGMDMDGFTFECRVTCKGVKGTLTVTRTAFREYASNSDMTSKIKEAVAASVKKPKSSKRRTVMFYDGGIVKKQINGVILVPRKPIRFDSKYSDLRAEAERQEYEEKRGLEDRYVAEVEKKVNAALESAKLTVAVSE